MTAPDICLLVVVFAVVVFLALHRHPLSPPIAAEPRASSAPLTSAVSTSLLAFPDAGVARGLMR